ncbi:MAG: hypothetical protein H8E17_09610 [Deltaproteobacteria bacterium]|nr:hypothetical protein [Deltaproteobacteria bacterium]
MKNIHINHKMKGSCGNKGMALLFTMVIMMTLSSIVATYLGYIQFSTRSTGAQISDSQAMYLADAGIQYGIYQLKLNAAWIGTPTPVALGEGIFSVSVTTLPGSEYRLISTGTVNSLFRTMHQDVDATVTPIMNTWSEQ